LLASDKCILSSSLLYCSSTSCPSSGNHVRDVGNLTFSPHIASLVHSTPMIPYGRVCSLRYSSDWGAFIVTGILEDWHSRRLAPSNSSPIRLRTVVEWSFNFCMSGEEHHNGQQETPPRCLEDFITPAFLLLTSYFTRMQ
jgi:hypothetical protein